MTIGPVLCFATGLNQTIGWRTFVTFLLAIVKSFWYAGRPWREVLAEDVATSIFDTSEQRRLLVRGQGTQEKLNARLVYFILE